MVKVTMLLVTDPNSLVTTTAYSPGVDVEMSLIIRLVDIEPAMFPPSVNATKVPDPLVVYH